MAKRSMHPHKTSADGGATTVRTLIERAYEQLRADIIEGRLAPGEKLRVEHLKDRYEVSAGTLREAITRLASDALVVAEGQRGFRVAPIALEELEDITQLRVQIETEALRLSIQASTSAWREAVQAAYDALSGAEPIVPGRRREWEQLNLRFHEALLSGHASPWTQRVLRLLSRHSERYRSVSMQLPGSLREVHAEHTEIYEYAMAGQAARAALALEAHIRATPDLLIQALREGRITLPNADHSQVGEALLA